MPGRQRSLSNQGCRLFNIAIDDRYPKTCLRSFIYNIFTSDFDEKLDKSLINFRNSTYKLLSLLNDEKKISTYFNNAVGNLVYLILVEDGKLNTIKKIKRNINFYYYLAEAACKNNDHNTALLIRTALNNFAIKRLKLNSTKKHNKINKLFLDKYGTFLDCNSNHLKEILENNDENFLPSLAILLMHYNKNKEYYKCYTKLGMLPEKLADKNKKLKQIVELYCNKYKKTKKKLQNVYLKDINQFELVKKIPEKSYNVKLIELSKNIK